MPISDCPRRAQAFTLVELILVMALLAIVMALSVPTLSRSMRQRHLADEALRFLALTEHAREEAISQGVPVVLWVDVAAGRFGIEPKAGYPGDELRTREYKVNDDVTLEVANGVTSRGVIEAMEFAPDGSLEVSSVESVRLVDRFAEAVTVARTSNGLSYAILEEAK